MSKETKFSHREVQVLATLFDKELKKTFLQYFDDRIAELNRFVTAYQNRVGKLPGSDGKTYPEPEGLYEWVQGRRSFKKNLLELLDRQIDSIAKKGPDTLMNTFIERAQTEINMLEENILFRETVRKYPVSKDDGLRLITGKLLFNGRFLLKLYLKKAINLFRSVFRKPMQELVRERNRTVPFRNMAIDLCVTGFTERAFDQVSVLMKGYSNVLVKIWDLDELHEAWTQMMISGHAETTPEGESEPAAISVETFQNENERLKELIHQILQESLEDVFVLFDQQFGQVDSLDLPVKRFGPAKVNARLDTVIAQYEREIIRWNNTLSTLYDDWSVDLEISHLYYSVYEEYYKLQHKIDDFIAKNLSVNFQQLKEFIDGSKQNISEVTDSVKQIRIALGEERRRVNEIFIDEILAQTVEKLTGSFVDDIEKLKSRTLNHVEKISDKRGFLKSRNYQRGVRDSEIDWISPRELLNFEALPHFDEKLDEIKDFVNNHLEISRLKLLTLGTVSDFSLESALLAMEQKKSSAKNTAGIAITGYDRVLNQLEEVRLLVEAIKSEPLLKVKIAIDEFNSEIQKLKNTDNIFELNMRIARIRAIERSRRIRREGGLYIKNLFPRVAQAIRSSYVGTSDFYNFVKTRMGITSVSSKISHEISDFITETEASLKKLPFVYQRLYQLQPSNEDRFFVNRENELNTLSTVFHDWQKDRFVTTAIIGEKGSGITSFLNYFLNNLSTSHQIIRITLSKKVFTLEDYFSFFSEVFKTENIDSNSDIIEFLNSQSDYKIIVLENLHHMFLKKIGGFECHKMLFDLMANTTKNVFWVGSYTKHSWDFLDKTIHISDHYIHEIFLSKLDQDTIEDIIFTRNRLSGYKIFFDDKDEDTAKKASGKLSEKEIQELRRNDFFSNLTNISNGNISLAQLYWLRSTREVTDDTIIIGGIKEIDFSFVKDISSEYLFVFQSVLIHDGLTLGEFIELFNLDEQAGRNLVIPMFEKGLLIRPKEKYNINPIIFRQVVNLLYSKNFIF
nr:hypothetical protein [Bacteroidota bacterium]